MTVVNSQEIIATYEAVLALTRQMLEAARKNEWDDLATLEVKRFNLIERLMASDMNDLSDGQLNSKKAELIQNILAGDTETRTLAQAWMVELREILDSLGAEKKLKDAYSATNEWR